MTQHRPALGDATGLYIHIPFCHVKCRFCDFAAYPGLLKEIPRYLEALKKELQGLRGRTLDTLFIGGGTPTVLEAGQLADLLEAVRGYFTPGADFEASLECNPESTTPEKLEALREGGINRLSFGLQAAQDHLLRGLGRLHGFEAFREVFRRARASGFRNLSVDLMFGLPGQTREDWEETLDRVLELRPEHLSAYALAVEERTAFARSGVASDGDFQADLYEWAADRLREAGFRHYEISNFARPGFECRHNLRYWKNLPCLGAGVAAASYDERGRRRKNAERVMDYLAAIEEGGSPVVEEVVLEEPERVGEDLMLALRLDEGAELSPRARELYGPALERFGTLGLLERKAGRIRCTRAGWLVSNQVFRELLTP